MVSTKFSFTQNPNSRLQEVDFDDIPFGRTFTDHMFVADYIDGEWKNMSIVPFANFSVHPANIAWQYGQAIFEGMKATKSIDGTPMLFRPEMHSQRINKSAERMCMPPFPEESFLAAVYELVKIEKDWIPPSEGSALYLRPYMVAMDEFIGVQVAKTYKFVIFCCPVGPYYSKPVKLKAETEFIRAAKGGTGEAKAAGNYAGSLYPAQIAKEEGYDQVLWLDAQEFHYIQEVGTMNIFFVINDVVITPPLDGCVLRGITRDSAIKILEDQGIKVESRNISINEVMIAGKNGELKEVFGAGTAAVVSNVEEIGYLGETIKLNTENYKVSLLLKDIINGIRSTRLEDKFGWTKKVV